MKKGEQEKQQSASYLDMDEQSEQATNDLIRIMFPAEEKGGQQVNEAEGEGEAAEHAQGEQGRQAGQEQQEEEAGQQAGEEEAESAEGEPEQGEEKEEDPEKNEDGEKKEEKPEQEGEKNLEQLGFIKEAVSELLPEKELSFESADDYKSAVKSLAEEYKSQKELAEKEAGANEEMVKLFDHHPELVSVVRHLRDKGSDFYEALYSVVDKDKIVPDKKTDPEGYARYILSREREKQEQDAFNEKVKENSQASQKVIDKFKKDRGYDDEKFNELMDFGHNLLKNLTEYKVTDQFLSAIEKAKNYEKDLAEAKKQGGVERKNETAKKRRAQKAGDTLPKMAGTGKSKKPEQSQPADPFVAALNDMADDEFGW